MSRSSAYREERDLMDFETRMQMRETHNAADEQRKSNAQKANIEGRLAHQAVVDQRATLKQQSNDQMKLVHERGDEERRTANYTARMQAKATEVSGKEARETDKMHHKLEQEAADRQFKREQDAAERDHKREMAAREHALEIEKEKLRLQAEAAAEQRRLAGDPAQLERDRQELEREKAALAAKEAAERTEAQRLKAAQAKEEAARKKAELRVLELKTANRERLTSQMAALKAELAAKSAEYQTTYAAAHKKYMDADEDHKKRVSALDAESKAFAEHASKTDKELSDICWSVQSKFSKEWKKEHWTKDADAPVCEECRAPFTAFHRRHHCRACGKCMCMTHLTMCAEWLCTYGTKREAKEAKICWTCYGAFKDKVKKILTEDNGGDFNDLNHHVYLYFQHKLGGQKRSFSKHWDKKQEHDALVKKGPGTKALKDAQDKIVTDYAHGKTQLETKIRQLQAEVDAL